MLNDVLVFLVLCRYSFSITSMAVIKNAQFNPNQSSARLMSIPSIDSQIRCACQCWTDSICTTAVYRGINKTCSLFAAQLWQGQLSKVVTIENTTTVSFPNKSVPVYNENIVANGGGESGPCSTDGSVTHPTGWSYSGKITQVSYSYTESQTFSTPGPSDRGQCYFVGNNGANPSMFQTLNLSIYANDIDQGHVSFNLSAWLGGYGSQNDSATVSIQFKDSAARTIGNGATIGPVLASDRAEESSTLFRQKVGPVPVNTRSIIVSVNMTRFDGSWNDASVDNIRVELYRT